MTKVVVTGLIAARCSVCTVTALSGRLLDERCLQLIISAKPNKVHVTEDCGIGVLA